MDAIEFIKKDIERDRASPRSMLALFTLVVLLVPAAIGIILRPDLSGVFGARDFIPNALAACSLGLFPVLYRKRAKLGNRAFALTVFLLTFATVSASHRIFFPTGTRAPLFSDHSFWLATKSCFAAGSLTAVFIGLSLLIFCFGVSSIASRRWRLLCSLAGGTSASVMLGFHCDSASIEHVLMGHVGPGVILGALLFLIHEFLFSRKIRSELPSLKKTAQPRRLS